VPTPYSEKRSRNLHSRPRRRPTLTLPGLGLSSTLEALWNDAQTDVRLKKRVIRTLIHDIIVDVNAHAGEVILTSIGRAARIQSSVCRDVDAGRTRPIFQSSHRGGAHACAHLLGSIDRECSQSQRAADRTRQPLDAGAGDRITQSSCDSLLPCGSARQRTVDESNRGRQASRDKCENPAPRSRPRRAPSGAPIG
jgi:hypothetical protein